MMVIFADCSPSVCCMWFWLPFLIFRWYPRTVRTVTPRCCWLVSQKQSRLWTKDREWNDGSWWFMMVQLNNMSDFQKATALSNLHLSWLDPHFGSPFRCFNLSLCRLQVPIQPVLWCGIQFNPSFAFRIFPYDLSIFHHPHYNPFHIFPYLIWNPSISIQLPSGELT